MTGTLSWTYLFILPRYLPGVLFRGSDLRLSLAKISLPSRRYLLSLSITRSCSASLPTTANAKPRESPVCGFLTTVTSLGLRPHSALIVFLIVLSEVLGESPVRYTENFFFLSFLSFPLLLLLLLLLVYEEEEDVEYDLLDGEEYEEE